jgi:hypothetical protein
VLGVRDDILLPASKLFLDLGGGLDEGEEEGEEEGGGAAWREGHS